MEKIGDTWTEEDKKTLHSILSEADKGWMLKCAIKTYYREPTTKTWFYFFEITAPDRTTYWWPEYFDDVNARRVYQRIEGALSNEVILCLAHTPDLAPFFDPDISKVFALISSIEKSRKANPYSK